MGVFDLFRPKWKHSDADVRIAAAREIDDPEILKTMAAKDREWFVRHRTFDVIREKFPTQEIYAFLAKHANDEEIRRKAVKKLRDEQVLQEVANNDKFRYVRDAAEHRLEELRNDVWGEKSQSAETTTATS